MRRTSLAPLAVLAFAMGCTTELTVEVQVDADMCGLGDDGRWVWGITEGECGVRPGPAVRSETVSPDSTATSLGSGRYCFWALGIDGDCRVRAGTSVSRRLPDEGGHVHLRVSPDACVADGEEPGWDRIVESLAGCVPSCEPERCRCAGAPSCRASGEEGACPAPITGDLLEVGRNRGCAATRGGQTLWCWDHGDTAPRPFGTPTAIQEMAVGPDLTCYLGPSRSDDAADALNRATIRCQRRVEGTWGEWEEVNRNGDCAAIPGLTLTGLVIDRLDVGDGFVCALMGNTTRRGLVCWGTDNPLVEADGVFRCGEPSSSWLEGPWLAQVPLLGALEMAAGDEHVCLLEDGTPRCIGLPFEGCTADGAPRTDHVEVAASGRVACMRTLDGDTCCSDGHTFDGLSGMRLYDDAERGLYLCGSRRGRNDLCGLADGERVELPPVTRSAIGPGVACGIGAGSAAGAVFCQPTEEGASAGGTVFASPDAAWVCPEEAS